MPRAATIENVASSLRNPSKERLESLLKLVPGWPRAINQSSASISSFTVFICFSMIPRMIGRDSQTSSLNARL